MIRGKTVKGSRTAYPLARSPKISHSREGQQKTEVGKEKCPSIGTFPPWRTTTTNNRTSGAWTKKASLQPRQPLLQVVNSEN